MIANALMISIKTFLLCFADNVFVMVDNHLLGNKYRDLFANNHFVLSNTLELLKD